MIFHRAINVAFVSDKALGLLVLFKKITCQIFGATAVDDDDDEICIYFFPQAKIASLDFFVRH